ncbi:MAG: lactoylglutathione lyase [Rhodobacterales bacterium]|nr:lactoylglutathione lyase [Rhodobacterales bacterium]
MRFLHAMVRVLDLEDAVSFFALLGLREVRRYDSKGGRYTNCFLTTPDEDDPATLELTYNWDQQEAYAGGRNFGHLAFATKDIYALCAKLQEAGVLINRPPRNGRMAFVRSPDGISVELLQEGEALAPAEPWSSMGNTGSW